MDLDACDAIRMLCSRFYTFRSQHDIIYFSENANVHHINNSFVKVRT